MSTRSDSPGGAFNARVTMESLAAERERTAEALRRSEERFRLAAEAVNGIIYDHELATGRVTRSRGLYEITGYSPDEVPESYAWWRSQIEPDDLRLSDDLSAAQLHCGDRYRTEYRVRHRDGHAVHMLDSGLAVRDAAGRVVRRVGCMRDVTEARVAEAALRRSEALFRAAQELSLDAFTVLEALRDDTGRIVDFRWQYANPASARLLRRPREELVGSRLRVVFHDLATFEDLFARYVRVVETGEPHDVEIAYEAEGMSGWFRNMAVRLGDGVAVCFSDITERKNYEAALREADRRKDEFLAMLAHELRNPLAPIRNALEVIRRLDIADPRVAWTGDVVDRQLDHLTRLVDDLLDVSRITRGRVTLQTERLELSIVLARAIETVRPLVESREQQLVVEFTADLWVDGDLTRLSQVVSNLLNNASKFTDPGGRVVLAAERDGDEIVVRVRDDGLGLAADVLPHVFDLFVQADRSLDRTRGGLGIGLTLVRTLVELHGGQVSAHSAGPGCGSEFVVRLPAADRGTHAGSAPLEQPSTGGSMRVLVVDDNEDSAESMRLLLELGGHSARVVADGPSALEEALAFEPDAVLLDIGLPGMDGYAVARELRARPGGEKLLLVALTGYGQEDDRRRSLEAGIDHHLVKPVDTDDLFPLLRR
jgi:two-component system CheB/CheR fusion protein